MHYKHSYGMNDVIHDDVIMLKDVNKNVNDLFYLQFTVICPCNQLVVQLFYNLHVSSLEIVKIFQYTILPMKLTCFAQLLRKHKSFVSFDK